MNTTGHYWQPIEAKWQTDHQVSLSEISKICSDAHRIVADIAQHPDFTSRPVSSVVLVQRLLIRRLGEELRGVEVLAMAGHGFQSISAAANLFEQSHFITYASASEEIAEQYRNWSDSKKSLDKVVNVVKKSGEARGWSEVRTDIEYNKYRFLCMFKHNNAMALRILRLPPPFDPDLVMGKLALAESIWFTLTAIGLLAVQTLNAKCLPAKLSEISRLLNAVQCEFPDLIALQEHA